MAQRRASATACRRSGGECFPSWRPLWKTSSSPRRASELELEKRGVYAGAVGYIDNDGAMDTCIAIRTIVMQGNTCHLQAGAGIVADSDPAYEFNESMNKLKALAVAVEQAERGI